VWTQGLAKRKQFLFHIIHPPWYSVNSESLVGGRAKNKSNPLPLRNKHFLSVNQFVMTIVEFEFILDSRMCAKILWFSGSSSDTDIKTIQTRLFYSKIEVLAAQILRSSSQTGSPIRNVYFSKSPRWSYLSKSSSVAKFKVRNSFLNVSSILYFKFIWIDWRQIITKSSIGQ
jgi:hypothetical protein